MPPRTQGGDLLRGDGVGDGLLQQLQAVQDPVAEPGAAGVQTLRGQEEGSWAGSTPKPAALGHPVGTGTSQGDPQAAPGTAPPLHLPQGHPTARDSGWETPGDNSSSARRPKGSPGAGRRGRAWYLVGFAQLPEASLQVVEVLLPLQHQSARQAGRRSAASSSPGDPLATRARIWAFFLFFFNPDPNSPARGLTARRGGWSCRRRTPPAPPPPLCSAGTASTGLSPARSCHPVTRPRGAFQQLPPVLGLRSKPRRTLPAPYRVPGG